MAVTTTDNVARVRQAFVAFNGGDPAGYASQYAADGKVMGPFFPEPLIGRDAIEQTTVAMSKAFPDMVWSIINIFEADGHVVCELHIEGTHEGPLPLPDGEVPPTGRRVSLDVAAFYQFGEDGLVRELREYMDPGAFMAQLGLTGE